MTEAQDRQYRERLRPLDRSSAPDSDFADRLERLLVDPSIVLPSGEETPVAGVDGIDGVADVEVATADATNRMAVPGRQIGRSAWLVAAAVAAVVGLGTVILGTFGNEQRTVTGPSGSQSTTSQIPPPTTGSGSSVSVSGANTTGPRVPGRPAREVATQLSGWLPDGTRYDLMIEPGVASAVHGISAAIVIDLEDGTSPAIGVANFERVDGGETYAPPTVDGGVYLASSGGWRLRLDLYDPILDGLAQLTDDPQRLLAESIVPVGGASLPRFELQEPFRWAEDHELPLQMEVAYGDLVVARGCGDIAVACSGRRGLQVIPADRLFSGAPPWVDRDVWIQSQAARPITDAAWLDPGPLEARGDHQVVWTGQEMIVWGGAIADRPRHLVDGAAFDPDTNAWRLLPPAPIVAPATTVALWAGDEMLVLSTTATAAYDPVADSWRVVGDGIEPGKPIWTGSDVVTVGRDGVHRFDRAAGIWIELPGAQIAGGSDEPFDYWWGEELLSVGADLYLRRGCASHMQRWTGVGWEAVDRVPTTITNQTMYQFCPWANQWSEAGGKILVWESDLHPTVAFDPADDTWSEIERIPLAGTEGPAGAIRLGELVLVTNWASALFDPTTGRWIEVDLPGAALESHMVWTGREILMWGGTCCYGSGDSSFTVDAWRWTP